MKGFAEQLVLLGAALAVALPLLVIGFFAAKIVLYSRRVKQSLEAEPLIGLRGRAESDIGSKGLVFVRGELWHACSEAKIERGASIRVVGFAQLALVVEAW